MRKRREKALPLLLVLLTLAACTKKEAPAAAERAAGERAATEAEMEAESPGMEEQPSPYDTVEEIVLRGDESREELFELPKYTRLRRVDATAYPCGEELLALWETMQAGPGAACEIEWTVPLEGENYSSLCTELDFTGRELEDNAELMEMLRYFPRLERVNLLSSGLTHGDVTPLADRYENIRFLWEVEFVNYRVRSDAQVFSTQRGATGGLGGIAGEDLAPLFRYCTDLVALDIGHNQVHDLTPLTNLRHLKVLILADNGIRDISPLAELTELEYLELFLNREIADFSPLNALTKMVDINLSYCEKLDSLEFMENMPGLKRCWVRLTHLDREKVNEARERYPEVELMFASRSISATCGTWRAEERNIAIRTAFARWKDVVEFRDWEHVVYREGAIIMPARPEIS